MNASEDWTRWGDAWRQQPAVDIERLQRRVTRKRLQMRVMVVVEVVLALVATSQLAILWLLSDVPVRWKVWALLAFIVVAGMVYLGLRIRKHTWRGVSESVPSLLRLTARRARAGIRLAWLNLISIPVLIAITVPIAAPWLAPSRWLHDPKLQFLLALQIGVNGTITVVMVTFLVWYIRRQRRRLRDVEDLLRGYTEETKS